jgi:hypothetical protein
MVPLTQTEIESFMPVSDEVRHTAPLDSWVAYSSDKKRVIAADKDFDVVIEQAEALGERDYILDKTPPSWDTIFVL